MRKVYSNTYIYISFLLVIILAVAPINTGATALLLPYSVNNVTTVITNVKQQENGEQKQLTYTNTEIITAPSEFNFALVPTEETVSVERRMVKNRGAPVFFIGIKSAIINIINQYSNTLVSQINTNKSNSYINFKIIEYSLGDSYICMFNLIFDDEIQSSCTELSGVAKSSDQLTVDLHL